MESLFGEVPRIQGAPSAPPADALPEESSFWGETPRVRRARKWILLGYFGVGSCQVLLATWADGFAVGFFIVAPALLMGSMILYPTWRACPRLASLPAGTERIGASTLAATLPLGAVALVTFMVSRMGESWGSPTAVAVAFFLISPLLPCLGALLWLTLHPRRELPLPEQVSGVFS